MEVEKDMDKKHTVLRTAVWEQLGLLKEHLQYILKNQWCVSLHYVIDPVGPGGDVITLENWYCEKTKPNLELLMDFCNMSYELLGHNSVVSPSVPSSSL